MVVFSFFSGVHWLGSRSCWPIGTACWFCRVLSLMFGGMRLLVDSILPLSAGGTYCFLLRLFSLFFGVGFALRVFLLFPVLLAGPFVVRGRCLCVG